MRVKLVDYTCRVNSLHIKGDNDHCFELLPKEQ